MKHLAIDRRIKESDNEHAEQINEIDRRIKKFDNEYAE